VFDLFGKSGGVNLKGYRKYFGKKKFFYSRNLNRPQELRGIEGEKVLSSYSPAPEKVYEKEFGNKYRGEVMVSIYQLK